MPAFTNQHGRRPGRGIRPWLLLPKILCVAVYLGSLASTLALWLATDFTPPLTGGAHGTIAHASLLTRFVTVPALLLAIPLGVALFLQHPGPFFRMRWLRVKLALIVLTIPAAHFYLSTRLVHLRAGGADSPRYASQFMAGLVATLLLSITIILIARLKPRFGQSYLPADKPSSQRTT